MKRILLLLLFLSLSFWLWSQSFSFRDPAFVAGLAPSGAAAAFVPTDISGCTLWLAADQPELTGYTDGLAITSWWDHSSSALVFTQGNAAWRGWFTNNAINGKPALSFQELTGMSSTPIDITSLVQTNIMTLFVLAKLRCTGSNQQIIYWKPTSVNCLQLFHNSTVLDFVHANEAGAGHSSATFALTNDSWNLLECSKSGDDYAYIYTNRVLMLSDSTVLTNLWPGSNSVLTLPAYGGFTKTMHGEVAEYIFYNRFLSGSERTNIYTYLGSKYALW